MEAIVMLLVRAAIEIADTWAKSSAEEQERIKTRALEAIAVLRGDREATSAAHDARVKETDDAIEAAGKVNT